LNRATVDILLFSCNVSVFLHVRVAAETVFSWLNL